MTGIANKEIISGFIDKINMLVDGGQLIEAAIQFNKPEMLEFYIEKGAKLDMPPDMVTKLYIDNTRGREYRKSPFVIQAACANANDCFIALLKRGCNLHE